MLSLQDESPAPVVDVAGFGNENTRGHGAGYQDRWAAGAGADGAWLAVADGIGGGPAGQEAAQAAIGLAQLLLGSGITREADLHRVFDSTYAALRPWWVQQRGGGTTLTVAAITPAGLFVAAVGDSPAYVDFGTGFVPVTEVRQSHGLREWLGSEERPQPSVFFWRWLDHDIRGVIVTSDGVDPAAVQALGAVTTGSAATAAAALRKLPSEGGDDASAAVAIINRFKASAAMSDGLACANPVNHRPIGMRPERSLGTVSGSARAEESESR